MSLREQVADALAHNDACGPGPVSRGEYLADADALIALIAPGMVPSDDAATERAGKAIGRVLKDRGGQATMEDLATAALRAAGEGESFEEFKASPVGQRIVEIAREETA